jgi:integrase
VVALFNPDVLRDTMELAVCGAMFLAGLHRGEIFALKAEDLDLRTPKLMVRRAWQAFDKRSRELGPTKGKKERIAPFDMVLQFLIIHHNGGQIENVQFQ